MKTVQRLALLSVLVSFVAGSASNAEAFFQKTKLEGTLGQDVGGVWLTVQHVMPTFRVRVDRADGAAPFKVGPVPKGLELALGKDLPGVVITEFTAPGLGDKYGLFVGDVVSQVNTTPVTDVQTFTKAFEGTTEWFLVTVHRASLKSSSARLIKIKYGASEQQTEGASELAGENVEVRIADVALPFADELETARQQGTFFTPSKAQVEQLRDSWYKLPAPAKPIYVSGDHRVVAAAAFDDALREDRTLKESLFAIVTKLQGNPLAGAGGQNVCMYGFQSVQAESAAGAYVDSTIATAPFPISIEFHGRFEMTKLAPYSDKDIEYQAASGRDAARQAQEEQNKDLKLAPDLPAVIPPQPKDEPAVAE